MTETTNGLSEKFSTNCTITNGVTPCDEKQGAMHTANNKTHEDEETNRLNQKRTDYLAWDDYFMSVAFLSAQRSKDPSSQVGACIVNSDKEIVGVGYNGMPIGCSDDVLPWSRTGESFEDTKYAYVCHAEMNAIMNKNSFDLRGCTVYVALFPCHECSKIIIQSRIKEVIYCSDKYHDRQEMAASRKMLDLAGIVCRQHRPQQNQIVIDFTSIERHAPKPTGMKRHFKES